MTPGVKFSIEERIQTCEEYSKRWQRFFVLLSEGIEHKKIIEKDEIAFQQIMHHLAANHFSFALMMGEAFPKSDEILAVLSEAVSLRHIKYMSEAQRSSLQLNWHTLFIQMNKCLGKLKLLLPPDAVVS